MQNSKSKQLDNSIKTGVKTSFDLCWQSVIRVIKLFKVDIIKANEYYLFVNTLLQHHGLKQTIKSLKDLNSLVRRIALRQKVEGGTVGGIWVKCFKNGIPKKLPYLNHLLKSNPLAAICISNCYLGLTIEPDTNIDTLTTPFSGTLNDHDLDSLSMYVSSNYDLIPVPVIRAETKVGNYAEGVLPTNVSQGGLGKEVKSFSLNAGPNHSVSLLGAPVDAYALSTSSHRDEFLNDCDSVGLLDLKQRFLDLEKQSLLQRPMFSVNKKLCLAKLAFLSNPGGKTRIVYILNFFHQNLLYPLHVSMMKWLSEQPQDGTYRQRTAALKVKEWTKQNKKLWSFDLTAATDRWPRWHQHSILRDLFGQTWADIWLRVMEIKPWSEVHNDYPTYKVGQPMGAYSSWATLAISHHILIRYLAKLLGVPPLYVVLGDDVVIADERLAKAYREYMTVKLGVSISEAKSFSADNQLEGSSAEFAKNIFLSGSELSPVSPILLKEVICDNQWHKVIDIFKWYRNIYDSGPKLMNEGRSVGRPKFYRDFIKVLPKRYQDEAKILTCYPNILAELKPLVPRVEDLEIIDNPWDMSKDFGGLRLLHLTADVINDKLSRMYSSLSELRTSLLGVDPRKLAIYGLSFDNHPLFELLRDLDQAVHDVARCIANGEHPSDAVSLLTDISLIHTLVVLNKPLSYWERSLKDRLKKERANLYITLYRRWSSPETVSEDDILTE